MKRIVDELTKAEKLYNEGLPSITRQNLYLLARYFRKVLKWGDTRVENGLIEYCEKFEENFSVVASQEMLDYAISHSRKTKKELLNIGKIPIYKDELLVVDSVKDFKLQTILLAMIVYSKAHHSTKNQHYYSVYETGQILELAKVGMSVTRFINNYYFLLKSANISRHISGKGRVNLWIGKDEENREVAFYVEDFSNIKKQHIDYIGEEIFFCKNCGKKETRKGKTHFLCKECSKKNRQEKERERKKQWWRNNKKN